MPRLAALCSIASGYSLRTGVTNQPVEGIPVVQLRNVDWQGGGIAWDALSVAEGVEPDASHRLRAGDVLFAARGQTNQAVVVTESRGALAASAFFVLRPARDGVDPAYLAWYLNTAPAQAHVRACAVGTKIASIPKPCLASLLVPLPPLYVQRRIAETVRLAAEERAIASDLFTSKARLVEAICLNIMHPH